MFLPHFCPKDDGFPEDEGPFLSSKDQFFRLSSDQRNSMVTFVAAQKATLCGESISPEHQHIQSYRDDQGMIQVWNGVDGDGVFFPFSKSSVLGLCWDLGAMLRNTYNRS